MDVLSAWVSFGEAMISVSITWWPLLLAALIVGAMIGAQS